MIDDHGFKSSKSKLNYNYEFVWIKPKHIIMIQMNKKSMH